MEETGKDPAVLVEERSLRQVTGTRLPCRGGGQGGDRGQPWTSSRPTRAKPTMFRLVRRPGHEGDRRQGQPGHGQRDSEEVARRVGAGGVGTALASAIFFSRSWPSARCSCALVGPRQVGTGVDQGDVAERLGRKLPCCRFSRGSYSSASRPRSLRIASEAVEQRLGVGLAGRSRRRRRQARSCRPGRRLRPA